MEEVCTATYTPVVEGLEEIEVVTGEEDENLRYTHLCLLYRFCSESEQWKGRGRGDIKLLKHKDTSECRLILREDKTFKLRMNAPINPDVELRPQAGSDRAFMWVTTDFSEGNEAGVTETFAVKFKTPEIAMEFKAAYEGCFTDSGEDDATTEGKAMTNEEVKAFIEALGDEKTDTQAVIDKYVTTHGVNTPSTDGFTLLMYAINAKHEEAVSILAKYPGIKLEVKGGKIWNFSWDEQYLLDGLHDTTFSEEMEVFDSGLTALMLCVLCGTKASAETLIKARAACRGKSDNTKDFRDITKARYDTEGAKHQLLKLVVPERRTRTSSTNSTTKQSPALTATKSPPLSDQPAAIAPAADQTGAAGFKFSSTPSFNFSWGKAAEDKKAVNDAKEKDSMPTDVEELKEMLVKERSEKEKVEQMLEDALVELKEIKTAKKSLQSELEDKNMSLAALLQQMGLEEGMEGDEGDFYEGEDGDEEEDDLE